jgi:hypothetical protein
MERLNTSLAYYLDAECGGGEYYPSPEHIKELARAEGRREALRDASILTHLGFSDAIPDEFVAGYEHGWEDYAAAIRALAEEEK